MVTAEEAVQNAIARGLGSKINGSVVPLPPLDMLQNVAVAVPEPGDDKIEFWKIIVPKRFLKTCGRLTILLVIRDIKLVKKVGLVVSFAVVGLLFSHDGFNNDSI